MCAVGPPRGLRPGSAPMTHLPHVRSMGFFLFPWVSSSSMTSQCIGFGFFPFLCFVWFHASYQEGSNTVTMETQTRSNRVRGGTTRVMGWTDPNQCSFAIQPRSIPDSWRIGNAWDHAACVTSALDEQRTSITTRDPVCNYADATDGTEGTKPPNPWCWPTVCE